MLRTKHQTRKKRAMFSNIKIYTNCPSDQYLFSCCWCFFVCCCYCFFWGYLQNTYTARDTFIVYNFTVLLFYCARRCGHVRFFFYLSSYSSSWSFIFLFRQFNHSLDQCLDFSKQQYREKNTLFLSFLLVNEARFFM